MNEIHQILQISASEGRNLLPYIVLGVTVAEAARYTSVASVMERICRQKPMVSILLGALLGAASPLCTYGTVPVVLQLKAAGMPLAPLITFLVTSSLMNPQLFIMTWGGLGAPLALGRVTAVLCFGLMVGGVLHFVPERIMLQSALSSRVPGWGAESGSFTWAGYLKRCFRTLEFVAFYVLVGILLGAAIEVLVPGRWIMLLVGGDRWWHLLIASFLGVPLYACGGGAIPLVGSLMSNGMSPGVAIAFLVAGPATRVPPLMALATLLRPRVVVGYVVLLLLYATVSGALFGAISP